MKNPKNNPIAHFLACLTEEPNLPIYIYNSKKGDFDFLTRQQLLLQARVIQSDLNEWGVEQGDEVVLCASTTHRFIAVWIALFLHGAVPVPIAPANAVPAKHEFHTRVRNVAKGRKMILADRESAGVLADMCPNLEAKVVDYQALAVSAFQGDDAAQTPNDISIPDVSYEDDAFIQFTSGSTRAPKGIIISHANILESTRMMAQVLEFDPKCDVIGSWLPFHHDMGLVGKFLVSLFTKIPLVLMSPQQFVRRPLEFLRVLETFGCSHCSMPNFALELLIRAAARKPGFECDLSSVRWLGVGSEPVRAATLTGFIDCFTASKLNPTAISPCYGLAEATLAVSIPSPSEPHVVVDKGDLGQIVGNGAPIGDFELQFLSDGSSAKGSSAGRLRMRSKAISKWAYVDGVRTSLVDEDGFFTTQDIAEVVDGQLLIFGRQDEMFCVRGQNYFPYDIEGATREFLGRHARRVACFPGAYDESINRRKVTLIYESTIRNVDASAVRNDSIRRHVLDQTGLWVDEVRAVRPGDILTTTSGKIRRTATARRLLQRLSPRKPQGGGEAHVS